MLDEPVMRREFERVVADHERRLDGHDSLYADLRQTREELIEFTAALRAAREQIMSGVSEQELCRQHCAEHRAEFEVRVRALERFRWQFGGAVVFLAALPTWVMLIWTVTR